VPVTFARMTMGGGGGGEGGGGAAVVLQVIWYPVPGPCYFSAHIEHLRGDKCQWFEGQNGSS